MDCSDFVARFTALDASAPQEDVQAMEEHVGRCSSCGRYKMVLEHGASLLKSLPEPELREDFGPRLRHRLYHVDDERVLADHATPAVPALAVLGIAILLTAVVWSPVLHDGAPVVELAPIVVSRAPQRSPVRPASSSPPGSFSSKTPPDLDGGLWDNTLLYDYSRLSQRYQQSASTSQVGLEH